MAEARKKMTPVIALRNFFGMKPGQTLQEFSAEVKELSAEERIHLAQLACNELGADLAEPEPTKV